MTVYVLYTGSTNGIEDIIGVVADETAARTWVAEQPGRAYDAFQLDSEASF